MVKVSRYGVGFDDDGRGYGDGFGYCYGNCGGHGSGWSSMKKFYRISFALLIYSNG